MAIGAHRKVVTVLFCDVVGSTALGESADPEALQGVLARYFERMGGIVESHGGSVEKFVGDAVMAVSGCRSRTRTTRCVRAVPRSRCGTRCRRSASMKGRLLLGALLLTLVGEGAAAMPLKADPYKPVAFLPPRIGTLASSFHPHRDRNHVFYVGSLKQARAFGLTKILPITYDPDYNFKKYGVLVIFYKGQAAGFGAGFDPKIEDIEESSAGDLSAKIDIFCYDEASCGGHQPDPTHPWGILIVTSIVKQSLLVPPKTVHVTTASLNP